MLRQRSALVLLTERDEVRRFRVIDVVGIRPTDPAGAGQAALRARRHLSARRAGASHARRARLENSAPITLAYVAESPIWRSTYRLLLDTRDEGLLQGWALVHNNSDEVDGVELELVNGRPDSFLYPLAAPRYARRRLETPPDALYTVPSCSATRPSTTCGETEIGDSFGAGGLGLSGVGEGGGGRGEGIGRGRLMGAHRTAAPGAVSSSLLSVGNLAAITKADAVEAGALFRSRLQRPSTYARTAPRCCRSRPSASDHGALPGSALRGRPRRARCIFEMRLARRSPRVRSPCSRTAVSRARLSSSGSSPARARFFGLVRIRTSRSKSIEASAGFSGIFRAGGRAARRTFSAPNAHPLRARQSQRQRTHSVSRGRCGR